jgi:uncharacterized membrane protein YdbT with pleckstrin-like domain
MINLNTPNKLPKKIRWYILTKLVLLIFFLCFITTLPFELLRVHLFNYLFWPLLIFLGTPLFIYLSLDYNSINFIVEENKITINSGIIMKRSKSIPFGSIQHITNVSGIFRRLFGLSTVYIWTSSPSQIHISRGESGNRASGILELEKADGEWLKNFILSKHS